MGNFITGSPNKALVKSGFSGSKVSVGQTIFKLWVCQQVRELPLELMTIQIESRHAETLKGVRVAVKSVAQVKVQSLDESNGVTKINEAKILLAAQHFLGDGKESVRESLRKTLEGHQRQILGTMTVESLYKDRKEFSELVRQHIDDDLSNLGFELASYVVQKIDDENGYMESLGITQTARVKREAAEGRAKNESAARRKVARHDADARQAEAIESKKAHVGVNEQLEMEAESDRDLKLKRAAFQREVNEAQAKAASAGPIEQARQQQHIVRERTRQRQVEEQVNLEIADKVVEREKKEKEGESLAKLLEEQNRAKAKEVLAQARADKIRADGEAEAEVIRMKGEAEAKVLATKAEAYKDYGEAAVVQMIMERLPEIANRVAGPLAKTEKMVFVSSEGSGPSAFTNDMSKMVGHVPEIVYSLTGFDMRDAIRNITNQNQGQVTATSAEL